MAGKVDKLILTNFEVLRNKYGVDGLSSIRAAIDSLIEADKQRGLESQIIGLNDRTALQGFSVPSVSDPADPKQNKNAIDGAFQALAPDYIMLLGASDVIPHQDLRNPLYTGPQGDDPDPLAYGDIPYACEAPYSQVAQNFSGPTRVVGRLPDITGGTDPAYLVGLLATAAAWQSVERTTIPGYFAVTAQVWEASSRLSTTNIFGNTGDLQDVPPDDWRWATSLLGRPMHLFNCHGAAQSPQFYGQPSDGQPQYPVALDAAFINGKLQKGTVVAAECCYGSQLYALTATLRQMGICSTYLANAAYGFWGSTTIAYGPSEGNGQADLICQYFLDQVLAGASLGRAALEARQKFVQTASPTDPSDIKTLAQFNLYGDPSVTPVLAGAGIVHFVPGSDAGQEVAAKRSKREDRRRVLFRRGIALRASEPTVRRRRAGPPEAVLRQLQAKAEELGLEPATAISFDVRHRPKPRAMPNTLAEMGRLPTAYHVLFARRLGGALQPGLPPIREITLLIGKEVSGQLTSISKVHSR